MKKKDNEINEKMEYYLKRVGLYKRLYELNDCVMKDMLRGLINTEIIKEQLLILEEAERYAKRTKIYNIEDLKINED